MAYITKNTDFTKIVLKVTKQQKPVTTKYGERTNFWSCNIVFKCSVSKKNIRYSEAKSGSYTEGKKQSIETS